MDHQIQDGILSDEMARFLKKSILAGISMLVISPNAWDASTLLIAFMEWMEFSYSFIIGYVDQPREPLASVALSNVWVQAIGIEEVTAFEKMGTLILDDVSQQSSYPYLQAMLRGQVIAIMQASDPIHAINALSAGVIEQVPQISLENARAWLVLELGLVVCLRIDSAGKLRADIIDGESLKEETLSYIYLFDEKLGAFKRISDNVRFLSRLQEIGSD